MARSCSCNDFTRSQLLRAGIAQAGRGLPTIEPGMPLPAGTGMNRRSFVLRSAGAMLSVYGAAALSPRHLVEGIAQAAATPAKQPILVSIFMEGGWDALSVLAPVGEAKYHELRPSLGLKEGSGVQFTEDTALMGPTLETFGELGTLGASSAALAQARSASLDTSIIRNQVAPFAENEGKPGFTSPVTYPTSGGDFPLRLAVLAAMLADEALPIQCVSLNAVGSYDTHSDEVSTLSTNLAETVESVVTFQRDLEARKLDDRVVIMLWSEFGRRPQENGSGTDHGAAGLAFLIGSRVTGKMVGEFPGLATLDPNENLINTSDFRAVYSALLGQWLQTEAGRVIPEAGTGLPGPSAYGAVPQVIA